MTARAGRGAAAGGGFRAEGTRALRAAGLEGSYVRCVFRDGQLVLTGEEGGWLRLPLAQVATLRLGCGQTPFGPQYEARVRRAGTRAPLVLRPLSRDDHAAYAQVLRAAAWALARAHGAARVEAGLTRGEALFGPLAMIPPALALAWVALFVAADIPFLLRLLIPLPALLLCVLLVRRANRQQYPRPVRSAEDLDAQLPAGRR